MKNFLETNQIELTCLTPVHIGAGKVLNKTEYVFNTTSGQVYFLDERKWLNFLYDNKIKDIKESTTPYKSVKSVKGFDGLAGLFGTGVKQKNKFDEFKQYVLQNSGKKSPQSLAAWCRAQQITWAEVGAVSFGIAKIISDKEELNKLDTFVRHVDGTVYIPGSSIKGAVRTAILYHLVKNNHCRGKWWQEIRQATPRELPKKAGEIERRCMNIYTGYAQAKSGDAVTSVLRGLQFSDADLVNTQTESVIYRKYDVSLHKNKFGETVRKLPLYRECVPVNTSFHFQLSIEKELLSAIHIATIGELIKRTTDFTQEWIDCEKHIFNESGAYWNGNEVQADLFLGGGVGYTTKTIMYALAPSRQEAVKVIREYLDSLFKVQEHNHIALDKELSPRTLKVAGDANSQYRMGLCKLEVVHS